MGKFFKKLSQQYTNRHIELRFHSADAPLIQFNGANSSAAALATFYADLHIQPEAGRPNINGTLARLGERGCVRPLFSLQPAF